MKVKVKPFWLSRLIIRKSEQEERLIHFIASKEIKALLPSGFEKSSVLAHLLVKKLAFVATNWVKSDPNFNRAHPFTCKGSLEDIKQDPVI